MLKPLHDNIILKKEKAENKTASGIILTNPKEEVSNQAKVIAVGSQCQDDLQVGMTVIFKEYSGTKLSQDDDEYIIIKEEDILAIVE